MPASFEQYLRLEMTKLTHVGGVRQGFDARQQLDKLSVSEIIQSFQRFLRANYMQALHGSGLHEIGSGIARLRREAEAAVLHYDVSGHRGAPFQDVFSIFRPTPRERLVEQLEQLAAGFARRWQAIVNPRPAEVGAHKTRVRPLRPGYSVGSQTAALGMPNGAGTLGAFIRAKSGTYLLSNAHVLATNPFATSDTSDICQPGPNDGGSEVVASVACHFPLARSRANAMDAAIAKLKDNVSYTYEYETVGALTGMRYPRVGETLTLLGRTTGAVKAVVQKVDSTEQVSDWTNRFGAPLTFLGVTVLKRGQSLFVNLEGDSGGLWIGEDNKAVALNFGGGEDSEYGLAIPVPTIVGYFQARLGDDRAGLVGIDNATIWTA